MKYSLYVNQDQAIKLNIRNINQAHIFDLLSICSLWAKTIIIENEVYYWVARQYICDELQILNLKSDTVYRHLKSLDELGLILYRKSGKKDCIKVTKKGQEYYSNTMSEINPSYYVGNKSENNSDLNPTYHTTNINQSNKKNIQKKEFTFSLKNLITYEKLSSEYKTKLELEISKLNLKITHEDFVNSLIAKGYKYKNFLSAYKQWNKKNFNNTPANKNTFDLSNKEYKESEEF